MLQRTPFLMTRAVPWEVAGVWLFCLLSKPLAEIEAKSVWEQGEVVVEPTDGKGFVDSLPPFWVSLSHPNFPS